MFIPDFSLLLSSPHQEMLAIMQSIYDMMGRYTYPCVRDEAPSEHVDKFFQVLNAHQFKTHTLLQHFFLKIKKDPLNNFLQCVLCLYISPTENG